MISDRLPYKYENSITDEIKAAFIDHAYRKDRESRVWFRNFKFAYDSIYGNPALAIDQGLELLNQLRNLNENAYVEIHKGGAFYLLGIASFKVRDFESATFFFDKAVSEDIRWGDDPKSTKPTPAMLFMRMDGEQPNQRAKELVKFTQARVEDLICYYNTLTENMTDGMTIQLLRDRLLIPSLLKENTKWRSLASTFISFFLEWDYRDKLFEIIIVPGTFEPFYFHIFKGCLLFESMLKENPTKKPPLEQNTLHRVLDHLHKDIGIKPNLNISGKQLKDVLLALDNEKDSVEHAILITGMIRNTLGHSLGWDVGLTKTHYQKLFQEIACSCIHTIAKLY